MTNVQIKFPKMSFRIPGELEKHNEALGSGDRVNAAVV
jgi:hypothetical protein